VVPSRKQSGQRNRIMNSKLPSLGQLNSVWKEILKDADGRRLLVNLSGLDSILKTCARKIQLSRTRRTQITWPPYHYSSTHLPGAISTTQSPCENTGS
jgi:hypothetical protein